MVLDANSRSSVECSTDSDDWNEPQFVFLLVLDDDRKRLLMLEEDGEYYLPFFEYAYRSGRHKAKACLQLQKKLGMEMSRQYFTAVYDMMGAMFTSRMNGKETRGYSNLLLVESSLPDFVPQEPAAWHDIESVSMVAEGHCSRGPSDDINEYIFEIVLPLLRGEHPRSHLSDIRYRHGWFQRASDYFTSTVTDVGILATEPVFQYSHSESSTLLALNTEHGRYYLKSPAAGCDEVHVTKVILQHLPEYTLRVIGTNNELNCFISEPIEILENLDPGDVKEPAVGERVVTTLARMQLDSRDRLKSLKTSGLQNRSPSAIMEQIQRWLREESFAMTLFRAGLKGFAKSLSIINEALMVVDSSGVPFTLVHGDVRESNFGRRKGEDGEDVWILHDWQFACISHPFFDLHCIYEDLSPDVIDKYLNYWTEFATIEKLKQVLPIACKLAWFIKAWTALDCLEACCPAVCPTLTEFFFRLSRKEYVRMGKPGLELGRFVWWKSQKR